jgi:DNA polymerase-3 subunit delta
MGCYFAPSDSPEVLAQTIGVSKFFVKDYATGKRNFSKRQVFNIISHLNEYDLKSKGYGNTSTSEGELLKELVFKILH